MNHKMKYDVASQIYYLDFLKCDRPTKRGHTTLRFLLLLAASPETRQQSPRNKDGCHGMGGGKDKRVRMIPAGIATRLYFTHITPPANAGPPQQVRVLPGGKGNDRPGNSCLTRCGHGGYGVTRHHHIYPWICYSINDFDFNI